MHACCTKGEIKDLIMNDLLTPKAKITNAHNSPNNFTQKFNSSLPILDMPMNTLSILVLLPELKTLFSDGKLFGRVLVGFEN